ncbi:hypothetical protein ACET3Z_016588 [Daucus carota]
MAEGACRGVVAGGFGEARGEGAKEANRRGYIPRDWLKKRIYMKGPASEEQEPLLQEEPEWLMEEEAKLRKNIYDPLGITRKGFSRTGVGLMNAGPSSAPEKTVEFMAPPPAPSAPPQSASIAPYGTKFFGVEDFFGPGPSGDKVESGAEEKDLDLDLKL